MNFGVVEGIQVNKIDRNNVRPEDGSVCVKIKASDSSFCFGRHFDEKDEIHSKVKFNIYKIQISRQSIDALKIYFKDEMRNPQDWNLIKELKNGQNIN